MKRTLEELRNAAIEMLKEDDDLLIEVVNELDCWNGYADGFRCEPMELLDDYYCDCKATKVLEDLTEDFNINDDYFYFSYHGLESTDFPADLYRDNIYEEELLDELLDNKNHLYFYNSDFEELLDEIEDFEEEEEEEEEEELEEINA